MPSLAKGGAERVVLTLCNNIDKSLFNCTILLLEKRGSYIDELHKDIDVESLDIKRVSRSFFHLKKYIQKHQPDIVFSSLSHMNLVLLVIRTFINPRVRFIVRESSIPSIHNKLFSKMGVKIMSFLYRNLYNKAHMIIAQCEFMKNDLCNSFKIPAEKVCVINNPVDLVAIFSKSKVTLDGFNSEDYNFLIVGSLVPLKQYDHVFRALKGYSGNPWKLRVLGDGTEMEYLQALSVEFELSENIEFLGRVSNPYVYMANSDCLIVTSKYEGFPNVVLESLVLGKPVIAYDAPGGVAEIIEDGKNGYLVPSNDVKKLEETIKKFDRINFDSESIKSKAIEKYNSDLIIELYQKVLIQSYG